MPEPVFELRCKLQNYSTGHKGLNGLAAQLVNKAGTHDFQLDEDECYAELWMGTHENGAAQLLDGTDLQEYVDRDKDYFLGQPMLEHFKNSTVPFLFKILTARKALQLQIHPDKKQAAQLADEAPDEFKDKNHKPEIALAVTDFEIFAGFRPAQEINKLLQDIPELQQLFKIKSPSSDDKEAQTQAIKIALKACFDLKDSREQLEAILGSDGLKRYTQERELLERANEMYPGDSGSFIVVFLMNYMTLKPGDACYVKERGIHAWFSGVGMIECMAFSDNVLNVGFLPHDDRAKQAFLDGIRFDDNPQSDHHVPTRVYDKSMSGKTLVYDPPIEEFSILRTELDTGESETINGVNGPGIFIVTKGSAKVRYTKSNLSGSFNADEGHVYFVAHGTTLEYQASSRLQVFEAISGEMMNRNGDIDST